MKQLLKVIELEALRAKYNQFVLIFNQPEIFGVMTL